MCVSAHPDDEGGATLAYYTHIQHVEAYSIFYTRGEGGQNVIGPELYNELGEIRTEETLAAAKILGTNAYFLGFPDFGFSKTAKETFRMWGGKDKVLSRIVFIIRALRPDVIITNHDTITTLPYRQHGNHQAVGITAFEAFQKAADPTYHPEQFKRGVSPWQVKKLFFRVLRESELGRDSLVTIPVSEKFGSETIQQIALDALKQHRTQGMDKRNFSQLPAVFRQPVYQLVRSDKTYPYDPHDLFSGIRPSVRKGPVLPSEYSVALKPFSIFVSPRYSLLQHEAIQRADDGEMNFEVDTFNHTGKIFPATFFVFLHRSAILDKRFLIDSTVRDRLHISVKLPDNINSDDSLVFVAIPKRAGRIHGLRFSRDIVYLKHVSAKFDSTDFIGVVATYDNTLQQTFEEFGVKYQLIDSAMLADGNLNKFTTIVLDIRGYLYRHDLVKYNNRILDYVKNGGNVVCFYNRPPEWNAHSFAPYPIDITEERVTEETQPVTILQPSNELFHHPNEIVPSDWNEWVQERNIYLPSGDTSMTSNEYARLLAMTDEDETEPSTSLLWAKFGRGTFVYTSLALYRQVKDLNNGGLKLLFNLISQPRSGN